MPLQIPVYLRVYYYCTIKYMLRYS